jgi:hypothetical protein
VIDVTGEPEIHVSRARARERPNKTTCHICHSEPSDELKLRFRIAWSGASPEVGHTRVAFTISAAGCGLAAISERRKVARIAARPTAGTRRQVDDRYASVYRLLIDKIFSKRYLALDRFGGGNVLYCSINRRHCSLALEFVESTRRPSGHSMQILYGMPEAASCRGTPILCFFRPCGGPLERMGSLAQRAGASPTWLTKLSGCPARVGGLARPFSPLDRECTGGTESPPAASCATLSLDPPPRDGRDVVWLEKAEDWRVIATSPPTTPLFLGQSAMTGMFARMLRQTRRA